MALGYTFTAPTSSSANAFAAYKQVEPDLIKTYIFGTVGTDAILAPGTPVGFNESTGYAGKWLAPDPTVLEVDTGGATGGTWGITYKGVVLANTTFAYNAAAALVQATIAANLGTTATVTLAAGVYTITFNSDADVTTLPTVSGDVTQLTGATNPAATATAGTATYGLHNLKAIVWPEPVAVDSTTEQHGCCMVTGTIDFDVISANVDSGDVAALTTACRTEALPRGLNVQKLTNVR